MSRIIDIAKHAGLSRVTVSGVLNGRHRKMGISDATAELVLAAAQELKYVPNEMSLTMKTGKSTTIGCIVTSLDLEWGAKTLAGALTAISKTNYSIRLSSGTDIQSESEVLHDFLAARVAGIFLCNVNPTFNVVQQIHAKLTSYNIPFVCNNCSHNLSQHEVEADNPGAAALAVEHLASLGHKRIAFIGAENTHVAQERQRGFISAMQKHGLSILPGYLQDGQWKADTTAEASRYLLGKAEQRPTAIVAANHYMAAVVLGAAAQLGLRVPQDLSVVGISDETLCEVTNPPLTSVCIAERDIGKQAMEMLIDLIDHPEKRKDPMRKIVPTYLKVRESTSVPVGD